MTTTTILVIIATWTALAFAAGIVIGKALRRADRANDARPSLAHEIIELDDDDKPKPPLSPPGPPHVTWHEMWWDVPDDDDPSMN